METQKPKKISLDRFLIIMVFVFVAFSSIFFAQICSALVKFIGNGARTVYVRVSGTSFSGFSLVQDDPAPQRTAVEATDVYSVVDDLNKLVHTNASIITEGKLKINGQYPNNFNDVTLTSLDPTIGTIDNTGYVTWVSDGTARILVKKGKVTQRADVPVSYTIGGPTTSYPSYISGSLGESIINEIADKTSGINSGNAAAAKPVFSTRNDTTSTYIRNVSSWAHDLDLTPISAWNDYHQSLPDGDPVKWYGGVREAGTLISPRHVAFANHFTPANGTILRFVTNNGVAGQAETVVERTLVAQTQPVANVDIKIGILDSDVPASISYAKILPSNWGDYMPGTSNKGVSVLYTDQEKKALIFDTYPNAFVMVDSAGFTATTLTAQNLLLSEPVIVGDSGCPIFFIINNQLVLISTWTSTYYQGANPVYGGGVGPKYSYYATQINSAMTSLSNANPYGTDGVTTHYQLTNVDLSSFPTF